MDQDPRKNPPGRLSTREAAVLRSLIVNRPKSRRAPGILGQLARDRGIGHTEATAPGFVVYTDADFERAAAELEADGLASGAGPGKGPLPRLRIEAECVAVALINMGEPVPLATRCVTITAQEALELDFGVILVCGQFEALLRLREFSWLDNFIRGRRTLAMFRGGTAQYRVAAASAVLDRSEAPVLGFFDFGPAGLHQATQVPRLEALCLPEWPVLEAALEPKTFNVAFPREFAYNRARLDAAACSVVGPLWERMKTIRRGLTQEGFPR
jgi:hypothetical protein